MKKSPQEIQKDRKILRIIEWNKSPKLCKECKFPISYDLKVNIFCSRSCMATHNNRVRFESGWTLSEGSRKQIANTLKTKYSNLPTIDSLGRRINVTNGMVVPEKIEKNCKNCNKLFFVRRSEVRRKYCSRKCADSSPDRKRGKGGAREGSGRSNSGYYRGIYCGSTYELCWVIYSLDHNVIFERFPGYIKNEKIKYYPDFLLEDGKTIVEIKGYDRGDTQTKTELAESLGYTVILLMKKELKDIFEYVKTKYNVIKFETLYDDSGRYIEKYVCDNCENEFETYVKRKKNLKFCSRLCAGQYINRNFRRKHVPVD